MQRKDEGNHDSTVLGCILHQDCGTVKSFLPLDVVVKKMVIIQLFPAVEIEKAARTLSETI